MQSQPAPSKTAYNVQKHNATGHLLLSVTKKSHLSQFQAKWQCDITKAQAVSLLPEWEPGDSVTVGMGESATNVSTQQDSGTTRQMALLWGAEVHCTHFIGLFLTGARAHASVLWVVLSFCLNAEAVICYAPEIIIWTGPSLKRFVQPRAQSDMHLCASYCHKSGSCWGGSNLVGRAIWAMTEPGLGPQSHDTGLMAPSNAGRLVCCQRMQ